MSTSVCIAQIESNIFSTKEVIKRVKLSLIMSNQVGNIFIAGAYGVGKTYLCNIISEIIGLPHYSASSLIKHTSQKKAVADVDKNQNVLVEAVTEINQTAKSILLDGHFCILNRDHDLECLDLKVFQSLRFVKAIVLVGNVDVIVERIKNRGNQLFDHKEIDYIQSTEVERANQVCSALDIPLLIHDISDGDDQVLDFIKQ